MEDLLYVECGRMFIDGFRVWVEQLLGVTGLVTRANKTARQFRPRVIRIHDMEASDHGSNKYTQI